MTILPLSSSFAAPVAGRSSPSGDAQLLVEPAQPLHRAVIIDRLVVPAPAQLGDHPLRLAQRIGADQHAALGIGVQPVEQPVDLAAGVGMAEHRQAEGRLGDEDVARHRHERRAGRVGPALVVARHDHPLAAMLEHDLRRAEHMAGGNEADLDLADPDALAIGDRLARLLAVAHAHDRQRLGRRPHRAMPAAGMVGMAVGDQRAGLGLRRIDPGVGGPHVDAFGIRLDPGTEAGHCEL